MNAGHTSLLPLPCHHCFKIQYGLDHTGSLNLSQKTQLPLIRYSRNKKDILLMKHSGDHRFIYLFNTDLSVTYFGPGLFWPQRVYQ